jgi:hypothetical protein
MITLSVGAGLFIVDRGLIFFAGSLLYLAVSIPYVVRRQIQRRLVTRFQVM